MLLRWFAENWQANGHRRADAELAVHVDSTAVSVGAAFDNDKPEACARALADILTAMKCTKKPFAIGIGNSNSAITNDANGIGSVAADFKVHCLARFRILHGIRQEVCKNMAQKPFIGEGGGRQVVDTQKNGAAAIGRRQNFVYQAAGELNDIE